MIEWFVENTIVASVLALAIALFSRFARPRPAVCHALWILVLVKLLVPPGLLGTWTLPAIESPDVIASTAPRPAAGPRPRNDARSAIEAMLASIESGSAMDRDVMPAGEVDAAPTGVGLDVPVACDSPDSCCEVECTTVVQSRPELSLPMTVGSIVPSNPPSFVIDWRRLAVAIWLVGALAMAVSLALRIIRFRRSLGAATPAPSAVIERVAIVARRLGVAEPRTLIVDCATSPFVWGLWRPRLVLPVALIDRLSGTALDAVLAHELAHLRRLDPWVGFLLLPAMCCWWWNPVFWCVRRRLDEFAELACDAWVVWAYPDQRRRYADTLIEVSLMTKATRPAPAMGMGAAAFHELERRFQMIMHPRTRRNVPAWGIALLALVASAALPGVSFGQTTEAKSETGLKAVAVTVQAVETAAEPIAVLVEPLVTGSAVVTAEPIAVANVKRGDDCVCTCVCKKNGKVVCVGTVVCKDGKCEVRCDDKKCCTDSKCCDDKKCKTCEKASKKACCATCGTPKSVSIVTRDALGRSVASTVLPGSYIVTNAGSLVPSARGKADDRLIERAKTALEQGRYDEALSLLQKAVRAKPAAQPSAITSFGHVVIPSAGGCTCNRNKSQRVAVVRGANRAAQATSAAGFGRGRVRGVGGRPSSSATAGPARIGIGGGAGFPSRSRPGAARAIEVPSAPIAPTAPAAPRAPRASGAAPAPAGPGDAAWERLRSLEREVERLSKMLREMKSGGTQL